MTQSVKHGSEQDRQQKNGILAQTLPRRACRILSRSICHLSLTTRFIADNSRGAAIAKTKDGGQDGGCSDGKYILASLGLKTKTKDMLNLNKHTLTFGVKHTYIHTNKNTYSFQTFIKFKGEGNDGAIQQPLLSIQVQPLKNHIQQ